MTYWRAETAKLSRESHLVYLENHQSISTYYKNTVVQILKQNHAYTAPSKRKWNTKQSRHCHCKIKLHKMTSISTYHEVNTKLKWNCNWITTWWCNSFYLLDGAGAFLFPILKSEYIKLNSVRRTTRILTHVPIKFYQFSFSVWYSILFCSFFHCKLERNFMSIKVATT